MPKIFILLACEECHHCIRNAVGTEWEGAYCIEYEQNVPDIGEIASFCELEDAEENKCLCPHYDTWDCQYHNNGKCELPDADTEITGIPCSHVGDGDYCLKCCVFLGEVKDGNG